MLIVIKVILTVDTETSASHGRLVSILVANRSGFRCWNLIRLFLPVALRRTCHGRYLTVARVYSGVHGTGSLEPTRYRESISVMWKIPVASGANILNPESDQSVEKLPVFGTFINVFRQHLTSMLRATSRRRANAVWVPSDQHMYMYTDDPAIIVLHHDIA